uniref:Haloacid dehalogenase-like hydrolase n=1 Tax=Tetradesmus obliquus TaxID=3088 RepID=A0A383W0B9_TETOB|eukprot:jgi/Sobl393_1/11921/SZX70096.1
MTVKDVEQEPKAKPVTLVSFDVDGTLIHSIGKDANKLHKECFSAGFKEVFGLDTHIDIIPHHGGTDPLIAIKVLEHCGVPKAEAQGKLKELEAAMVRHFQAHADRAGLGLELLPGVEALLEALQARGDVASCLVTGNLEPIGWGKMAALGIDGLFSKPLFGGFGSDFCSGNTQEMWRDRAEFVRLAGQRAEQQYQGGVRAAFHVGDTPMDIQAALAAGCVAVGVTTGVYSRQQLEAAGEGVAAGRLVVLDSLEDVDAVLKVLQLE